MSAVECCEIRHAFGAGEFKETVLHEISLSLAAGESCVLLGPSGSGKTTLLSILGCLLTPNAGEVRIGGEQVTNLTSDRLSRVRRRHIGFVFQHSQLLTFLSAYENCAIVGRNAGMAHDPLQKRLAHLFERLGISQHGNKKPGQLSGGQQQRVAIARALVHSPTVVLADEPTAALDWTNGRAAVDLLIEQAKSEQAALIAVTHDHRLVELFDRVFRMESGKLVRE